MARPFPRCPGLVPLALPRARSLALPSVLARWSRPTRSAPPSGPLPGALGLRCWVVLPCPLAPRYAPLTGGFSDPVGGWPRLAGRSRPMVDAAKKWHGFRGPRIPLLTWGNGRVALVSVQRQTVAQGEPDQRHGAGDGLGPGVPRHVRPCRPQLPKRPVGLSRGRVQV
jgi:hypothetical protein